MKSNVRFHWWYGVIAAAVVLVAAWVAGIVYYSGHFYPQTFLNGHDVSMLSADEASERAAAQHWRFTVSEGPETWTVTAQDLGMSVQSLDYGRCLADQQVWAWPAHALFGVGQNDRDLHETVTYDDAAVEAFVAQLPCVAEEGRPAPQDAYPELAADGRSYTIHPEVLGGRAQSAPIAQAIRDDINARFGGQTKGAVDDVTFDVGERAVYERPRIGSDYESLVSAVNTANLWLSTSITYDIDGIAGAELLDAGLISQWVSIERHDDPVYGETGELVDTNVSFVPVYNGEGAWTWIRAMGEKYDTAFVGGTVTCADGAEHYIVGGGVYGWITDEEAEYQQLTNDVSSGTVTERSFAMKQEAQPIEPKMEGRYVEVDIAEQHVWLFDGGVPIWDSRAVTGSPSHPTVVGTFSIYSKQTDTVLVGDDENKDGKPDYESPVSFWMPFYGGYGLHDASGWRGDDPASYGGGIRYYNGSHGCVNLPGPAAEWLYSQVEVGTPVVVH